MRPGQILELVDEKLSQRDGLRESQRLGVVVQNGRVLVRACGVDQRGEKKIEHLPVQPRNDVQGATPRPARIEATISRKPSGRSARRLLGRPWPTSGRLGGR
ncbi:hypothetical protein DAD99_20985 [Pseudarthrobacter sp. AB1]|nr:hypothetical protein [Pseudarthrobacter sp. AB1]